MPGAWVYNVGIAGLYTVGRPSLAESTGASPASETRGGGRGDAPADAPDAYLNPGRCVEVWRKPLAAFGLSGLSENNMCFFARDNPDLPRDFPTLALSRGVFASPMTHPAESPARWFRAY